MPTVKDDFLRWTKTENRNVSRKLSDIIPTPDKEMFAGQTCTFTNEYKIKFPKLTIMGFCRPELEGRCVYLDKDSYWFPVHPDSITLDTENYPVTLDTALMLQNLGFYDEKCEDYYYRNFQNLKAADLLSNIGNIKNRLHIISKINNSNYSCEDKIAQCPTLYNAFKWLIDRGGLELDIIWHYINNSNQYYKVSVSDKSFGMFESPQNSFPTFEKSLEAGLQQALEIIY